MTTLRRRRIAGIGSQKRAIISTKRRLTPQPIVSNSRSLSGSLVGSSHALDGFRLHYAPSRRDLVQHRSTAAEQRAWSAALGDSGFTLRMEDEVFPRRGPLDRTIRFDAYPVTPQTMRVSLNGKSIGTLALPHEWHEYSVKAPAALWSEGLNTLTVDFEKAVVPSPYDPRELAVSFKWISIGDPKPAATHVTRIAADTFIDENTAWRNTKTHFPPAQLRRLSVPLCVSVSLW